jgi:hypothetical protein
MAGSPWGFGGRPQFHAPVSASISSACACRHCRSSMTGRRWITTLRKLPTSSDSRNALPMSSAGFPGNHVGAVR